MATFLATYGKIWPTFYFNIWSHWSWLEPTTLRLWSERHSSTTCPIRDHGLPESIFRTRCWLNFSCGLSWSSWCSQGPLFLGGRQSFPSWICGQSICGTLKIFVTAPKSWQKKSMTIFFRIDWMIVFWKVELPKYLNNLGMFGQWLWHSWQRGCVWHRGPWFESSHRQLLMNNYLLTSLGYPALPGMIQMIF